MVRCKDCLHFGVYEYGETAFKPKTGCYHPDNMVQKQDDGFLKEQEIPGNHVKLNLDGDCSKFELRPARPSWVARLMQTLRT